MEINQLPPLDSTNHQVINPKPAASQQAAFTDALNQAQSTDSTTIQWGDTLSALAVKYHTTVAQLATANHISNPDMIYAGNQLIVPGTANETVAPVNPDATATAAPTLTTASAPVTSMVPALDAVESSARDYIVTHESHGSYTVRNGKYIGKYQLDQSYLNGDFSPANQERVAQDYVSKRYGSWANAMAHWKTHQWY